MFSFFAARVPRLPLQKDSRRDLSQESPRRSSPRRPSPHSEPIDRKKEMTQNIGVIPEDGITRTVEDLRRGHGECIYFKGKKVFLNDSNYQISDENLQQVFGNFFGDGHIGRHIVQTANQFGFLNVSERYTKAVLNFRNSNWIADIKGNRYDFIFDPDGNIIFIERFYIKTYVDTINAVKVSPRGIENLIGRIPDEESDLSEDNRPLGIFVTKSLIKVDEEGHIQHTIKDDVCYVLDDRLINPAAEITNLFDTNNVGKIKLRKTNSFKSVVDELNNNIAKEIQQIELQIACNELDEVTTPKANDLQLAGQQTLINVKQVLAKEKVSTDEMDLVTEFVKSITRVIEDHTDADKRKKLLNDSMNVAHIDKPRWRTCALAGLLVFSLASAVASSALIPASGGLTGPLAILSLVIAAKSAACLIGSITLTCAALLTSISMSFMTFKLATAMGPLEISGRTTEEKARQLKIN